MYCFFRFIPVDKNVIVFYVCHNKGFGGNSKYLLQKLNENSNDRLQDLKIYYVTKSSIDNNLLPAAFVKARSIKHFFLAHKAKVYITDDSFPSWFIKKKNQLLINLWHGAFNFKSIGYSCLLGNFFEKQIYKRKNIQPDYFVSGSKFFTENTAKSFGFDKKVFLEIGLPRNDLFFSQVKSLQLRKVCEIKNKLNIDKDKLIVLYAPTFRNTKKCDLFNIDVNKITSSLKNKFNKEVVFFYKAHSFVKDSLNQNNLNIIDLSNYEDISELLLVSDVLISDYSSCMWDFSLIHKPVFAYASDIAEYKSYDRTFAFPIEKWPFTIATDTDELSCNINSFEIEFYLKKVKDFLKKEISFDKGNASEKLCKIILNAIKA